MTLKVTGPAKAEHHGLTIGVHISPAARLYVAVPRKSQVNARTGDGSCASRMSRVTWCSGPAMAA